MASKAGDPWKAATFALAGVLAGALATAGVVELRRSAATAPPEVAAVPPGEEIGALAADATLEGSSYAPSPFASEQEAAPEEPVPSAPRRSASRRAAASSEPVQHVAARPASADIETCNRYASTTRDKARNALEKGVIGGLVGAAVGAAGGAIADGGSGAGKGAGIGGIVGAAAGTAYGINQTNQADARAEAAYRDCMQRRGYTSYARY